MDTNKILVVFNVFNKLFSKKIYFIATMSYLAKSKRKNHQQQILFHKRYAIALLKVSG